MIPVCNSAQIRECDRITIEELGIPGIILMENASRAVAAIVEDILDRQLSLKNVLIFAGKGNNGGDGFAVARYLKNLGSAVLVFLIGEKGMLRGDAKFNCELFERLGGDTIEIVAEKDLEEIKVDADLWIDALLGTGFEGEVRGLYARAIDIMNSSQAPVLSIDIPSGIEADTGRSSKWAVQANQTVTFGLIKQGFYFSPGRELAGEVLVADIGIPPEAIDRQNIMLEEIEGEDVVEVIPNRHPTSHKGDAGHVYVVAGSPGMTGASVLAAKSALKTGCGLVVVGIPKSLSSIIEIKLTEAMSQPLPESANGGLSIEGFDQILARSKWADCMVIGPGLGVEKETGKLLEKLLLTVKCPIVIDADGLNLLAGRKKILENLPENVVLTPHPGEFLRLTGLTKGDLTKDRVIAVRECARKWKTVIVLKGSPTLIGGANGSVYINTTGNPGMATGGSGDVLSGIIGSLIAQGMDTLEAAWAGVFIHGSAGDSAKQRFGVRSMVAGDIVDNLSGIFENLS